MKDLTPNLIAALLILVQLITQPAMAARVGAGFATTSEFPGSNDYRVIPLASFEVDTRLGTLSSEQIGLKLDIVAGRRLDTGPLLRYQGGRDNDLRDALVSALPEINGTAEIGWFASSGLPLKVLGFNSENIATVSLKFLADAGDGHGGTTLSASAGLVMPVSDTFSAIGSASLNFSNQTYQRAFFGVSDAASGLSGLPTHQVEGGLESAGFSLILIRSLSGPWSLTSINSINQLLGDAADSPIVGRGSATQLFFGLALGYEFD